MLNLRRSELQDTVRMANRYFHHVYPFKIEVVVPGASLFRAAPPWLYNDNITPPANSTLHWRNGGQKVIVQDLKDIYQAIQGTDVAKIRIEGSHLNLFIEDQVKLEDVLDRLPAYSVRLSLIHI